MKYPLATYKLGLLFNAPYGSVLSRLLGPRHKGVDFLPAGDDDVKAMDKGVVVLTSNNAGACGKLVDIKYDNGLTSRYCHLKDIKVTKGVKVTSETIVGTMGATGTSYPKGYKHLHVAMWNKNGTLVDPLSVSTPRDDNKPLIDYVNQYFREIWERMPLPKESLYFQTRVAKGIKTEKKLREVMKYWHAQPRWKFILEQQKLGIFG